MKTKAPKKTIPHSGQSEMNKARAEVFAAQLEGQGSQRPDGGKAFVRESDGTSSDTFATEMGKDFLIAAETGREVLEELSDEDMPEDSGGPFIVSTAGNEFADGVDASNPTGADREAFPTVMRQPPQ
jgi:hypothetical protein